MTHSQPPVWKFIFGGHLVGTVLVFFLKDRIVPAVPLPMAPAQVGPNGLPKPRPLSEDEKRLRALAATKRPPLPEKTPEELTPECREFFNGLRDVQIAKMLDNARELPMKEPELLPTGKGCNDVPGPLDEVHKQYTTFCAGVSKNDLIAKTDDPKITMCRETMMLYRGKLTDWATRDTALKDIADMTILSDKLLANFRENPVAAAEAAERMLELDPTLHQAAKASMLGRLRDAASKNNPQHPAWDRSQDSFEKVKKGESSNPNEMIEAEFMMDHMRYKDPERAVQKGSELTAKNPTSGTGPYVQAWAEVRRGNKEAARALIQEAIRREPNNRKFQETLAKGMGERDFQIGIGFTDPSQAVHQQN